MVSNTSFKLNTNRYAALLNTIPDGLLLLKQDGTVLYANHSASVLFGYSSEEFIGLNRSDLFNNSTAALTKLIKTRAKNNKAEEKLLAIHKNNTSFPVSVYSANFFDEDIQEELVAKTIKDLTQFSKSYNDITKILDASLDIISVVNENGEFIQLNNAVNKIWGYSVDELLGKKNTDLVIPADLNKTLDIIEKIKQGVDIINFENTYRHKNGQSVDMSWSATMDATTKFRYAIGRDITEKVKRENQLKLLESVITNTNDAVIITEAEPLDKPGPRIVYVNEAFEKMTLYSKAEVIGQSPRILQGPKSDRQELNRLKKHLLNWEAYEIEIINYKKNREPFWVNFTVVPVKNEHGWFTHWISIQKDITERKKQEVEKNKLINELVENNKDLKQFSYITSHNLRAPVTNLMALIKLFDWNEIKNEENKSLLQSFEKSTKQLNDSINDLLQILVLKEKKVAEPTFISFLDTFNKTLLSFSVILNELNVQFIVDFSGASSVLFNKEYLESIFTNLISNAIKYKSPNRPLIIEINSRIELNHVVMQFKDNGSGIDLVKNKDKIFKLFQTFHHNKDSKGVGLYLIQTQLNAFGGKIEVESEVDKGANFILYFKQ